MLLQASKPTGALELQASSRTGAQAPLASSLTGALDRWELPPRGLAPKHFPGQGP